MNEVPFNHQIPFPEELEHLAEVNRKLKKALDEADQAVDQKDREYMEEKRYMVEYRGEIDPHEMFQNELALTQMDRWGAFAVKMRDKIIRLLDSPYFARVDFRAAGGPPSKCYIGRFSFSWEDELLVCDWRSPVASLFYDWEAGPAGYDAPTGHVDGELIRKRQFKIKDGIMEYALESASNIQDDVLQRELSHASDEKMKSIIATIQKEQNQVIRNEKSETLLIQGVAGSGKTSIALHRLAYMLYRFKDQLSARNVMILSPNRVFGDYISNVLPELGEEPIFSSGFADIARVQLEGIVRFAPDRDPLEIQDESWARRVRFKSTLDFLKGLDQYLEELPHRVFTAADYTCGEFIAKADIIQRRFEAYSKYPVKRRLRMIAEDIHRKFTAEHFMEETVPGTAAIRKGLNAMLKIKTPLALYRDFYQWMGVPKLFVMPERKTLEWADVYPFLYLYGAFEGLKESGIIRHVVVDEMQDYTPVQYAVLNRMFPCRKTILGDFGQSINPNHQNTLADLRQLYEEAAYVELNKSYRSTYEIMDFAKKVQKDAKLEPMVRHGDAPRVLCCGGKLEEIAQVEKLIDSFEKSGHRSLGIITKTNREANALYEALAHTRKVRLLSEDSRQFGGGVFVTSIRMSKGLEFDRVILFDADGETYATEHDRRLLYIACTRAMHKLTLLHTGEPPEFVKGAL